MQSVSRAQSPAEVACRLRRRGGWTLLAALAASLALATGCERTSQTMLTGQAVRGSDLAKLTIGRSTAADVERILGAPDERGADGSLVYRATAVRRSFRSVAGVPLGSSEQVVGSRTARFQFAGGVLQKVCRERS